MTPDDILYAVLLLFCVVCGFFVRRISNLQQRRICSTLIGFSLLTVISSYHIIHPVILTVVNAAIVLNINKQYCHVISFIFCFTYLMFIRTSEYFGVPAPPEVTNTALMIMVLKMVGLAYEVNIQHLKSTSSEKSDPLKEIYTKINPSFANIFQYSFCYAGLLVAKLLTFVISQQEHWLYIIKGITCCCMLFITELLSLHFTVLLNYGPYYKYRTYEDLFCKSYNSYVPHFTFLKRRIIVVPVYMIFYLISDYFFPLSLAASEEIWKFPFLYRLFYMMPWFFSFRMRIYVAFVLGECICINLGLGAYPENCSSQPGAGPTNFAVLQEVEKNPDSLKVVTYDFETVRCMDEFSSEFRPTIREGIRYWNMTVQYWLAIYIYRKTAASKPVKMFATMFVSAIWHGVRPGYYLSLLGTPLLLLSEIEVEKAFRKNLSESAQKVYDFVWYFIKMQSVSYMGIAFILLDLKAVIHYWNSIYYIGHFFTVFLFVIAFLKSRWSRKYLKKDKKIIELNVSKSL